MRVSRTCTEIRKENGEQRQSVRPLEEFRSVPAYVLLGDPGAGKSTAFEMECEALGEDACKIDARNFRTFNPENHPEWRGKTLFIDGLDEVRAGSSDANTPFDEIRNRLDTLGKPHFRLSCREADWFGASDRKHLEYVSPDSAVTVLRLDPLTEGDIVSILDNLGIKKPHVFISSARENRVYGLLENPQTLELLAEVVGDGDKWPASRKELFEEACDKMVREHNKRHKAAKALSNPPEPADLLDAAGRLCAVQLISGAVGWTLHGEENDEYPELDRCQGYPLKMLRSALGTKLFKAVSGDNSFISIHRHIAEFLAARHLAGVIEAGVPARRIIALITGKDGVVVTEMRGLSAWLAAYSKDARAYLIEQDPVGVGLYGDIGGFFTDEKRALLYSLKGEKHRLDYPGWKRAEAFRALVTPDMEPVIRDILTDSNRAREHQRVIGFVLSVLREHDSLPDISEILLEIVRDGTWWPDVNLFALDAFIRNCPDSKDKTDQLKALLADIHVGDIPDTEDELLGTLLTRLYPKELSPSEVWDYLAEVRDHLFHGRYFLFWRIHLVKISSDEQVVKLLDNLGKRLCVLRTGLKSYQLEDPENFFLNLHSNPILSVLPFRLLVQGLKAYGDQVDKKRLYDWLDSGCAEPNALWDGDQEALREIRLWLEQRPDVWKAIVIEGLERCSASDGNDGFDICALQVERHLYGAHPPPDYGLWCFEQAIAIVDSEPRAAEFLLKRALAHVNQNSNDELSHEFLQEQAGNHEILRPIIERLLQPPPPPSDSFRFRVKVREEEEQSKLDHLRSSGAALRENRAAPYLLHRIAQVYFAGLASSNGGLKVVTQYLNGDQDLTDAALQGLRGVVDRGDVPDVVEIFESETRHEEYYLGLPFLAALEEIERRDPEDDASQWDDDRIRKSVAFYYCYGNTLHMPSGHDYCPEWYRKLLAERPEIVAEVLVQYGRCVFQVGHDYADPMAAKFRKLETDPDHAQVARYATLPLLRSFPIRRAPEDQSHLSSLNHLLWAAIKQADRALLQELIESKRSLKSITAAQRVRWLAAGAMVWPGEYTDLLKDFVQEDQDNHVRYLKAFFGSRSQRTASEEAKRTSSFAGRELLEFDASKVPLWELFIRLMGSVVGPDWWGDHAFDLIRMLIKDLVVCPEDSASDALASLLADPALEKWRDTLKQAQDNQRTIRRDAGYRHPDIEQVCETLDGGTPANPADLAALLMDRLSEIAVQIRTGNTDDWRQYWEKGKGEQPDLPRHEDLCRDALLSDLQQRLPQGIDAQREGSYANDKRADIRVFYAGFNVPVEIKKNSHLKLWRAIRDQLIAKYTIDPGTDGYGIYLVFWFGKEETRTPHERGYPDNPEEMEQWLKDSLSPEQARKISVCVIDVSIPEGKSAGK